MKIQKIGTQDNMRIKGIYQTLKRITLYIIEESNERHGVKSIDERSQSNKIRKEKSQLKS